MCVCVLNKKQQSISIPQRRGKQISTIITYHTEREVQNTKINDTISYTATNPYLPIVPGSKATPLTLFFTKCPTTNLFDAITIIRTNVFTVFMDV